MGHTACAWFKNGINALFESNMYLNHCPCHTLGKMEQFNDHMSTHEHLHSNKLENKACVKQTLIFVATHNVRYYRSLENFRMKLFRCEKISCKKISWLVQPHEKFLTRNFSSFNTAKHLHKD